jgi:hypothetical protein
MHPHEFKDVVGNFPAWTVMNIAVMLQEMPRQYFDVAGRSRSGGSVKLTTRSRYSKSSRKAPLATCSFRLRWVAATMRTSTW